MGAKAKYIYIAKWYNKEKATGVNHTAFKDVLRGARWVIEENKKLAEANNCELEELKFCYIFLAVKYIDD